MKRIYDDANAPICVFGYNRPDHLLKCLDSLAACKEAKDSDLFVFCDGPKNTGMQDRCSAVAQIAVEEKEKGRFKNVEVKISEKNNGLAKSIITGVTNVIEKYGKVIVIEDDLVVSNYYLKYMNESLLYYSDDARIWSVTGYTYPLKALENYDYDVYLSYRICSYGWGTWIDRWEKVDWEVKDFPDIARSLKKIRAFNRGGNDMFRTLKKCVVKGMDVWAIKFSYAQYKNEMYTVYPKKTLIESNGYDGSGTNSQSTREYNKLKIDNSFSEYDFSGVQIDKKVAKEFERLYRISIKEWLKYRYSRWKKKCRK